MLQQNVTDDKKVECIDYAFYFFYAIQKFCRKLLRIRQNFYFFTLGKIWKKIYNFFNSYKRKENLWNVFIEKRTSS